MIGNSLPIILLFVLVVREQVRAEIIKDPSLCSRTRCVTPSEQKFKYAEGVLYRYYHSVDVSTNLGGRYHDDTEEAKEKRRSGQGEINESTLFIDSTVTLHFLSPCEGYIRITNASIRHDRVNYNREFPDRADAEFRAHLERHALRFAFDDGHVREVCPEAGEVVWALNFKRGILSMLQNTMKRFDVDRRINELDINGICETRYRLREAKRTSLIIRKSKDLTSCTHGGKHLSVIQSTFYRSPLSRSRHSSQPLLRSYSDCEITIDHNVYEKVACRESHILEPFSNGASAGARTNTVAVLRLFEESKEAEEQRTDDYDDDENSEEQEQREEDENRARASITRKTITAKRTSLLYDHSASPRAVHGELRTCRDLLKSMCALGTIEELQQRFSEMYTKFIHSARLLDYPSMSQLLARANGICKGGRKHIIDALPFVGSNAAVKVMRDLIIKKAIDGDTTNEWVTAFALIPRPDAATLLALVPLLDFEREIPEAQFILGYSAVVHAYCANQEAGQHCVGLEFKPIDNFMSTMENTIERGCAPRAHDLPEIKQTLEALKAIGNMGLETPTLSKRLKACIDNVGAFIPMEVRVSAIDAHRRLPSCPETRDRIFLNYYRNLTLDSEIRIASYIQVMRCPDYNVIKIIKHTLKHEQANQVGSFVWSHLTNLLASSSPTRVEIQSLLTDRDLGNKFNSDLRKYSRSYEKSVFSEEWNLGANYQSNLIFSSKSYVPRSASFNLTVDLFGESVNVLEISMRMEGIEYYVERIFGPEGPLSNEKVGNHLNQFLRTFRSARDSDDDYRGKVKRLPNVIDNNFDDPKISMSYKIFGNELRFKMLNGDREIRSGLASLNPWTKIKQILSGREFHYENTVMFLDSSYVVPTTSGLPVRLELAGSAAYNFKFSGLLDSERLASNTEVEVVGNVTPSFSIDVTGRMIVDAFYKSAGLKLRSNVYSFGAVQLHLKIKGARLVRVGLDLPNSSMEVISIRTDVLLVSTNGAETKERLVGKLLTGEKSNKQVVPVPTSIISNTTCSWPALERLIGLKLCADYQFPNVTKMSNASYFILNGPTLFKVSVIKADPTAKSYLLEYKWDVTPEESVVRLAFDTPGSQINRELSATVSFDIKNHNVTVLLRSAGNSLVAKGTYKRTDDEAMIDVGLDINGTKHLDASVGYTRKRGNYGYTYTPKLYLAINSERIAELSGTIRNAQKHNVSQCDIDLSFETKKVKSHVQGYIMRRSMSLTGNVKLDYQLNKSPKKETLQVEISLVNRSSKTLTHKEANLKLYSTAYPQLNAVISTWYQQALGHIEIHAEINTKPHLQDNRHKLTVQLVLTHSRAYFQSQEAKINAFIAITKPIMNLDIKVGVQHFAVGATSKTNFLIRYAPGKEISLAVNMVTPRGNMFAIEGHANLTIPNFNSMLIDARISERARREYDLDFSGTWFSGHNITIRGTYADRSTTVIVSHSLKMILTSPSFRRDILLTCKLYQDTTDLKINLHLEHLDLEKYALIVDHSTISPTRLYTYAEARYKSNVYTMTTNVDTEREIRVELHLDRWRDVQITATGISESEKKEFGIQVKWDANRDPALKFATVVQLNKFVDEATFSQNISGTVIITYPNRLVTGSCLFARQARTNYLMDTRLDWGPDKTIRLTIDTDYGMSSWPNSLKFESQLLTPFENWKKTSLNARYRRTDSQVGASCSAYWQDDQRVLLDFQGDTRTSPELLECSAHFGLTSSVHSIGWLTANLTHKQVPQRSIDSRLLVNYDPDKVIDLKSIWIIDRDAESDSFNITGNLQLASPMANYRRGEMKCQLRLMPNWRFYGASNLDLDKRKYTAVLEGDLARFKESLVKFNVTTPLERYAFLRGRFGLSERDRHIVAEVLSPSGSLGFEALCQLFTGASYDFHVKLQLATPIELLQRSLFVAKLNRREADFRVAYNNITAGFQGVWHYNNITDFHYSYVLLTPIHGLHESGIVAKLVAARTEPLGYLDLDTEFSLRIVETKIGVQAHGGPKPPPPVIPITSGGQTRVEQHEPDTKQEDEEEDEMETFYWKGDIEINAAIIAPIVGTVDIDIEGPIHKILGFLKLPQGRITIDDRFTMEDLFNMKNELSIDTPFLSASEITSLYIFSVDSENSIYFMEMDLNVLTANRTIWAETGLMANYSYVEIEDDSQSHILELKMKTPLRNFKYVNTSTVYEIDENMYKARTTVTTEDSRADLAGTLELEDGFLDAAISAQVDSPALYIPRTKIVGKKDFTDKEKRVEFAIHLADPKDRSAEFQASWRIQDDDYVKASLSLETWIVPLRSIEAQILYVNAISTNNSAELRLNLKHSPEQEYRLIGDFNNGTIDLSVHSSLASYEHLHFRGDVERPRIGGPYIVNGDLKNLKTSAIYGVIGSVVVGEDINEISEIEIEVTPRNGDRDTGRVLLKFQRERNVFTLNARNYNVNGTLDLSYANAINWNVNFKAEKRRARDYEGDKSGKDIYELNTYMDVQANGNTTITVRAVTPWKDIEIFSLDGNLLLDDIGGQVKLNHRLNENTSHGLVAWKLAYMIDMFGRIVAGVNDRSVDARLFLKNPKKAFKNVEIGFDVDIDRERWRLGTNATVGFKNAENVDVVISVRLPPPNNDDHRLLLSYHGNHGVQNASYVVGYNALRARTNYASDGSIRMAAQNLDGHLRVTWGILPSQTLNNILNMTFDQKSVDFKYSLYTPKCQTEETAIFRLNYDASPEVYSLLNADLYYPAAAKIGTARISYSSLSNVNGTVNATTPIPQFSYAGCNFIVLTTLKQNRRFAEVFWPNNTALLNSDYNYHSERLDSTLEGVLQLEIPLSTRHIGHMTYGYKKRPLTTNGYAHLTYNKEKILNATYNSKGESRAGFDKDRIHIIVENIFKPIGIIYVNQYEYSAGNAGTNYPTVELKRVNVYGLDGNSTLKVAGESKVRTTHDGQEIYLKGVHYNRTIQLKTDYQVLSGEFDQNTWVSLAEDAWASYHINILNKTTREVDNQLLVLNLAYPRRNFTLDGSYTVTRHDFHSEARLTWDENTDKPRIIRTALKWKNSTDESAVDRQVAVLSFGHPSFAKDVTFTGKLMKKDPRELFNSILVVDYSTNPDKLLVLSGVLRDESKTPGDIEYSYAITGNHPKTQLDLRVNGNVRKHETVLVETDHRGLYKRSYLPQESGQLHARIDANDYEIQFHRESNELVRHLQLRYYPADPAYVLNGTVIDTPDLNATGAFYINVPEKLTWMMLNYTPDAVESLRMYGYIPDVRNAIFDIWRTYDQDLVVNDVSFYIKLNHSRLVTSKLKWRPELRDDICNLIKASLSNVYDEMGKDMDYWKQYIRSETVNAITDVWEDAREDIQQFLEDWDDLKSLERDFDDLKIYLNGSYNANDFYIKDIVAIGVYVIDELSLRSHIESLPNIINEIWEIMGESGEAIRNSVLWIIETIKNGYKKFTEIVSAVVRGESVTQIANIVEKLIEKYDMFVKDLHVSFIKYIQNLWNKFNEALSRQWNEMLKMIEPVFIRVIHYVEAVLWKVSKEVVDFLYDRRNEIIGSPYFDRFTNLTHDVDRIYRDIKANDIVTNVQKYSAVIIQFIRERYFNIVPFGKELKDLVDEIASELKELTKLPTVNYALEKAHQAYEKAKYLYEYLGVRAKIESAIRVAHSKLIEISQTALQAESRYREAKTKFIFDPDEGLLCLEQKLPMSWHAFNQTPEFQEIPEYRAIVDIRSYFTTSNTTFWTLYYQYKPYTEPSNWLPPFRAQAMIVGSQHFITFDDHHLDFVGSCTYLLARDFVRNHFAVLIEYDRQPNTDRITHRIIVLIGRKAIELDVFKDTVKLVDTGAILQLPVELENGTAFVYQEESIVTVETKHEQLKLRCNLKYDLCILELSGYYYGKTAGLLGTMNNEPMDDTLSSNGTVLPDVGQFAQSWSLERSQCTNQRNFAVSAKRGPLEFCDSLFVNKSSEFSGCFNVVNPDRYAETCVTGKDEGEVCTLAMSYMQMCSFYDTYLRIPDKCTTCPMLDGSTVPEGEFRKLDGDKVPSTTDVVFIVEAKGCNEDIRQNRSIDQLISQLSKELEEQGLTDNRWSLVTFGGDGVYDRPRNLILESRIFTEDASHFADYFSNIPTGNGNQDIFAAIGFASQLVFRAGVSKTFVLMPCTHCEPQNQTLDYSVLHQVLLEHDITLHILMDGDFHFKKQRVNKMFYGLDAHKSYTRKDAKTLVGDVDLRRQVKLSKSALGYCAPLSLETNGTIFSGDKLRFDKPTAIKKFAGVFSKRVAVSAKPSPCQHCECTADNDGITHMECMPCVYPMPVAVDYVSETFNEDDALSLIQPLDVDYGQIDIEDE